MDEMGLNKRDAEGYRLRPDGKRLNIIIEMVVDTPAHADVAEMVREYWEDIGFKTVLKTETGSLYHTRLKAAEHDVGVWGYPGSENSMLLTDFWNVRLGMSSIGSAPLWDLWRVTNGEEGEEPPENVKRYYGWLREIAIRPQGSLEYIELGQKIFDFHAENVWSIGTVGLSAALFIQSRDLKNVPLWDGIAWSAWGSMYSQPYLHEQWFLER